MQNLAYVALVDSESCFSSILVMDYVSYYRGSTSGMPARDEMARHQRSYSRDSRSHSRDGDRERSRQKRHSYGSRSPSYSYRHRDSRSPDNSRRAQMSPEWKTKKRGSEEAAASFDFASSLFQDLLKATGAAPQPLAPASPHLAGRGRGGHEHSRSSRDRSSSEDSSRSLERKDRRLGRKRSSQRSGSEYGGQLKRSRTGDSRGRRRGHHRSYSRSRSGSSPSSSSVSYQKGRRRRRSRSSSSLSSVSSSSLSNSPRTRGLRELDREYNRRKEQKSERLRAQSFSPSYSVVSSTDGIESNRQLTEEQFREEMYRRLRSELSSRKDPARREERIAQHIREMAKLSPTLFREFMVNNAENLSAMSILSSESPEPPHREQQRDDVDSPGDSPPYVKQQTVQITQDSSEPAVERKSPESKSSLEDVMQKLNQYKNKLKERNELTSDLLYSRDIQPLTVGSGAAVEQQVLHGEGQSETLFPSAFASFEEKEKQYEAWQASFTQTSPASSSMLPENVQGISVHVGKMPEGPQRFVTFPRHLIPVKGQGSQQDAHSGSSIRPSSLMSGRWKDQGSASAQLSGGKASASFSADRRKHHSPPPRENKKSSTAKSLLDLVTRKPEGKKYPEKGKPSLPEKKADQGKADKPGNRSNKTSSDLSGKRSESSSKSSTKRPESSKNESSSERKSEPGDNSHKKIGSGQLAKELLDKHNKIALVQKELNALKKIQYDWLVALGHGGEKDPVITENVESQEELNSRISTVLKGGQGLPNFPGSYMRSRYRSGQTGKGEEKFHVGMSLKEFIKQFSSTEKGKVSEKDVTVAGKIQVKQISKDKPNLFELCEEGVKIQIISKQTFCKSMEDFKVMEEKLKKGDLVGVRGRPGMSKTGLLSIVPSEVTDLISVQSSNSTHMYYAVKDKQTGRKGKAAAEEDDRVGHCCIPCQVGFHALRDFLTHLHSEDHQTKTRPDKDYLRPWQKQDLKKYQKETPQTKAKGEEFLVATGAFYCFLCSELCSDSKVVDAHLTSWDHHRRYQDYLSWNPNYEKRYKEERAKMLSAAGKVPQASSEDRGSAGDRTERDRDQETRSKDGDRKSADRDRKPARDRSRRSSDRDRKSRSRDRGSRSKSRERRRSRSRERNRRSRSRERIRRSRSRDRSRRSRSRDRSRRSRSRDRSRRSRSRDRNRRSRSRNRSKRSRERDRKSKSRERDHRSRDRGGKSKERDERPAGRKSRDRDMGTDDREQSEKSQAREGIETKDKQAASSREKGEGDREKSDRKGRVNDGDEDVQEMDVDENTLKEKTSTKKTNTKEKPHTGNQGFLKTLSWREEIERQMALMFHEVGEGDESKRDLLETEDVSQDPSEKQIPELDDDITTEDEMGKTSPKEKRENTLDGEMGESDLTTERVTTEDQGEPPEGSGDGVQKPSIPKATQEQLLSVELASEAQDAVKTETETSDGAPAGVSEASSMTVNVPPPAVSPALSDAELMPPPMSVPSPGLAPPVAEVTPHSVASGMASAEVDSSHAQPPPVPKGSEPSISPEQLHLQSAVSEGHAEPVPSQSSAEPVSAGATDEEAVHLEPGVEQPVSSYYGDENISSPEYKAEDVTCDFEDSVPPAVDVEDSLSCAVEESASLGVYVENLACDSLTGAEAAALSDGGAESNRDMCESGTTPPATSAEAVFTSLPDVAVGSSELDVSSMKAASAMEQEVQTLQGEGEQYEPVTACLEEGNSRHSYISQDDEEDKIILSFGESLESECQDSLHEQKGNSCRRETEVASPMIVSSSEADPLVMSESSISDAKDSQNKPVEQSQVSALETSDQTESLTKESPDPEDVSGDNMTVPVEEDKDGAAVLQEGDQSLEVDMADVASTSSHPPPPLAQALSPQAHDSSTRPSEESAQLSDVTAAVMAEGEGESEVLAQINSCLVTGRASPGDGTHQQTASLSPSESALLNTDSSVSDSPASSSLKKRSATSHRGRGKKKGQSRAAAPCPADEDSVVTEEEEEELIVVTEQATPNTSTRQTCSHTVQPQQSVENQEGEEEGGPESGVELHGSSEQSCENSSSGAVVVDPDSEKMEAENVMPETAAETESVPCEEDTQTPTDDVPSETPSFRRRPTRQSKKAAAETKSPSTRATRGRRGRGRGRVSTRRSGNLPGEGGDGSALLDEETCGLSASSQGEEEGEGDVV